MIFKQLFIIFLFSFLGEVIAQWLPFPVPSSVVGMILLFLALRLKWVKIEQVDTVGSFLTDNMAIFFVPAGVGLMLEFEVIQDIWLALVLIVIISVFLTMGCVGKIIQWMNTKTLDPGREEWHHGG